MSRDVCSLDMPTEIVQQNDLEKAGFFRYMFAVDGSEIWHQIIGSLYPTICRPSGTGFLSSTESYDTANDLLHFCQGVLIPKPMRPHLSTLLVMLGLREAGQDFPSNRTKGMSWT